jgi:hypothetical protein
VGVAMRHAAELEVTATLGDASGDTRRATQSAGATTAVKERSTPAASTRPPAYASRTVACTKRQVRQGTITRPPDTSNVWDIRREGSGAAQLS